MPTETKRHCQDQHLSRPVLASAPGSCFLADNRRADFRRKTGKHKNKNTLRDRMSRVRVDIMSNSETLIFGDAKIQAFEVREWLIKRFEVFSRSLEILLDGI